MLPMGFFRRALLAVRKGTDTMVRPYIMDSVIALRLSENIYRYWQPSFQHDGYTLTKALYN